MHYYVEVVNVCKSAYVVNLCTLTEYVYVLVCVNVNICYFS